MDVKRFARRGLTNGQNFVIRYLTQQLERKPGIKFTGALVPMKRTSPQNTFVPIRRQPCLPRAPGTDGGRRQVPRLYQSR